VTAPRHGGVLAAESLLQNGIDTIFALPGAHVLPLFEGARQAGLRLIDTRHEENAVMAAEGMALCTGRTGVAAVTAGPGLANAFAGIAEANAAGAPVVVIAGRTAYAQRGRGAVQDLDQLSAMAPVTKWRAECPSAARIPWFVGEAVHQARSGAPGVAYLEIPQDVFTARAEQEVPPWPARQEGDPARPAPAPDAVERAVEALERAARPVAVAGSGAFFSGASDALGAFVERTGIPVTTTSAARGLLDDGHKRCLGSLVHGGIALASADVALVLGSRFNANLLYGGLPLFPPGQIVIQVDVLADHLGGQRRPEIGVVADVSAFLEELTAAWPDAKDQTHAAWAEQAIGGAATSRAGWEAETERPANGIHPGWLARKTARFADEANDGRSTFVCDGGDSVLWGIAFARARRPGTHLFIGSAMGTLGVGLPFATAARIARPDERPPRHRRGGGRGEQRRLGRRPA
jgi:thiamine pyrophosphate-dependent acetolactate synthase large subunit-like protein